MDNTKKSGKQILKAVLSEILDIIDSVLSSVFVVLVIFTFVFSIARVEGRSMLETLQPEDRLVVSQLFYTPEDGDVIIINSSTIGKKIVKRVIATEGQTLEITNGQVFVDGAELEEDYLSERNVGNTWTFSNAGSELISDGEKITVPAGFTFVMGDNRVESKDSRMIGMVDNEEIVGKVVFRLYPVSALGFIS